MSNIAALLKSEITRLSKKVIRQHVTPLRATTTTQRRQLAQLRQQVLALQKEVASLRRNTARPAKPEAADDDSNLRFVAKGFKTLRSRLDLSAEEMGLILGVSSQSVFNWENGRAKPRAAQLPAIAALRALGKREVQARLAEIAASAKAPKRRKAKS